MTIKTLLANALAILIAAVAAEGIVRVAIHPALDYTSGFSPGPYCSRPPLGISFNCPDYVGMMHEIGTNLYLPYRMNEEGFRGPYDSSLRDASASNIVVLGGQSQAFGYGLLDEDTISAQIAKVCVSADIHVFSLPSLSDAQSWKLYNLSAEAKSPPDQIVLMIYTRARKDWRGEMKPESRLLSGPFVLLYGWLYTTPKWLEKFSGSYLIVRSVRSIREIGAYFGFGENSRREFGVDPNTQDFISAMVREARRLNAKLSVVFLPGARRARHIDADSIERALPDVRFIDIDAKTAALDLYPAQSLPDGHYNATLAAYIGAEIARSICATSPKRAP